MTISVEILEQNAKRTLIKAFTFESESYSLEFRKVSKVPMHVKMAVTQKLIKPIRWKIGRLAM